MLTKWLGAVEAAVVVGGFVLLVTGLYLLATSPLLGVMVVLSAMALLLGSIAKLSAMQEARCAVEAGYERVSRRRPENSSM